MFPNPVWLDSLPAAGLRIAAEVLAVAAICGIVWFVERQRGRDHPDAKTARFLVTWSRTYFPVRDQVLLFVLLLALVPLGILFLERVIWRLLPYWPVGR